MLGNLLLLVRLRIETELQEKAQMPTRTILLRYCLISLQQWALYQSPPLLQQREHHRDPFGQVLARQGKVPVAVVVVVAHSPLLRFAENLAFPDRLMKNPLYRVLLLALLMCFVVVVSVHHEQSKAEGSCY